MAAANGGAYDAGQQEILISRRRTFLLGNSSFMSVYLNKFCLHSDFIELSIKWAPSIKGREWEDE